MKNTTYIIKIISIFLFLLVIYLLLIQLWKLSSSEYKPADALDHVTRTGPTEISDWSGNRRLHD